MASIIDKVMQDFDSNTTVRFSEKQIYNKNDFWLPTGSPELEYNLGVLGYPIGLVELSGMSKSGKTTMALVAMRNFQRAYPDGVCVILSSENRENKKYAEDIGVDTSKVIIVKSRFVEDLFWNVQKIIKSVEKHWASAKLSGKPKLFLVWDSIGATLSRGEANAFEANVDASSESEDGEVKKMKNAQIAVFAKNAKLGVKMVLAQLWDKDVSFLALNHRSDNISGFGGGTYSTGGHWVEFLPSLRLEFVRTSWVKQGTEDVGQITQIKVDKNDYGSRRPTNIEILLGKGLILSKEDLAFAASKKILEKYGTAGYSFLKGKLKWTCKKELYQLYWDNNPFLSVLTDKILALRHEMILEEKGIEE